MVVCTQSLINNRAEATTALLMQLCTDMGDESKADGDWVAKVADFAHLYAERCVHVTSSCSICMVKPPLRRRLNDRLITSQRCFCLPFSCPHVSVVVRKQPGTH